MKVCGECAFSARKGKLHNSMFFFKWSESHMLLNWHNWQWITANCQQSWNLSAYSSIKRKGYNFRQYFDLEKCIRRVNQNVSRIVDNEVSNSFSVKKRMTFWSFEERYRTL